MFNTEQYIKLSICRLNISSYHWLEAVAKYYIELSIIEQENNNSENCKFVYKLAQNLLLESQRLLLSIIPLENVIQNSKNREIQKQRNIYQE